MGLIANVKYRGMGANLDYLFRICSGFHPNFISGAIETAPATMSRGAGNPIPVDSASLSS